ncbi:MAG: GNAT family N-acetyltransferase [Candidatus Latescibacterota bacterium]
MNIRIMPVSGEHIESLRACLDSVARERWFLAFLEAPPEADFRRFVMENIFRGAPHFVALEVSTVIGWCDIVPRRYEGFTHIGKLGMGVHRDWRGKGIGTRLIDATLERARELKLERIELEVFASNGNAVSLYRKTGFEVEGVRRKARKIDGLYEDIIFMALLFPGKEKE